MQWDIYRIWPHEGYRVGMESPPQARVKRIAAVTDLEAARSVSRLFVGPDVGMVVMRYSQPASEGTKQELMKHFHLPEEKAQTVYAQVTLHDGELFITWDFESVMSFEAIEETWANLVGRAKAEECA